MEKDITFVVQGAVIDTPRKGFSNTASCLRSIRERFPESKIILSTYEGSNVSDLIFDTLVLSRDPGGVRFLGSDLLNNLSRQLVTSKAGLERVKTRYACKTRTDTYFMSNALLYKLHALPLCRDPKFSYSLSRFIIPNLFTNDPFKMFPHVFNFSDLLIAGRAADLKSLFDIPLPEEPMHTHYFYHNPRFRWDPCSFQQFHAEQYIWLNYFKKRCVINCEHQFHVNKSLKELSNKLLVNNCVVYDHSVLGVKVPFDVSKERMANELVSHNEWSKLYSNYCLGMSPEGIGFPVSLKHRFNFLKFMLRAFKDYFYVVRPKLRN